MKHLRDLFIAVAVGGFLWYALKLQPVVALVLVITLYFSMRSINRRFPGRTPPSPSASTGKRISGKRRSRKKSGRKK